MLKLYVILCALLGTVMSNERPNIVFVLTDNQDVVMGGFDGPMRKTQKLVAEEGVTFSNAFATTPVCCPSRSTILTGKYPHNHKTVTNLNAGHCNDEGWRNGPEKKGYAAFLQSSGYQTMFAGKYLNRYGLEDAGGIGHIPPGWTHWRALVGNSKYYNYTFSIDGVPEYHGLDFEQDYFTNVVQNKAISFLESERDRSLPFFMCLSTSAPHDPETPAPKYEEAFPDAAAPRTPAFNLDPGTSKHWFTRMSPSQMSEETIENVDERFRRKWRSLLSVDDMVEKVIDILAKQGILHNTYVVFTSDHGYHLGQFAMPFDMRNPYEFDIRIPLVAKGPGIRKNVTVSSPVLTIDLAPSFLDMAGISSVDLDDFDGVSFLSHLSEDESEFEGRKFLIEYVGEGHNDKIDPECSVWSTGDFYMCYKDFGCRCVDTKNNTYSCLRSLSAAEDNIYCYFEDSETFEELYDIAQDPHQLTNLAYSVDQRNLLQELSRQMAIMSLCQGRNCDDLYEKSTAELSCPLFSHRFSEMLHHKSLAIFLFCVIFVAMFYRICAGIGGKNYARLR